jgi:hypothetical protein
MQIHIKWNFSVLFDIFDNEKEISNNFITLQYRCDLNTNYGAERGDFKFIVPLNAFTRVRCTKTGRV